MIARSSGEVAGESVDIFQLVAPDLLSYFERRCGHDAADLLAETFVVAWRRRSVVPADRDEARRWLFGVAHGVLANARRSGVRRGRLADRLRSLRQVHAEPQIDDALDVRRALESLPIELVDVVTLIHWEGFTSSEVADILGIAPTTVRSRHADAKQRLLTILDARGDGLDGESGPSTAAAELLR